MIVLVVDDDAAVRQANAMLLGAYGYAVQSFEGGDELIGSLPLYPVACVVLDVMMPVLDGLQTLKLMRHLGFQQPVIFMTGHGEADLAELDPSLNVFKVLPKPCNPTELIDAIEAARGRLEQN